MFIKTLICNKCGKRAIHDYEINEVLTILCPECKIPCSVTELLNNIVNRNNPPIDVGTDEQFGIILTFMYQDQFETQAGLFRLVDK